MGIGVTVGKRGGGCDCGGREGVGVTVGKRGGGCGVERVWV